MAKAAIAGGEIYYEDTGAGEPLIFVSGLNGIARGWQSQVAFFSTRFRVVTYDHRGTGSSDKLQRAFSIDQMTAELVGLLDVLDIERAHVVGLSTGGAIAQTLGIVHPGRVKRLVMCSTWTHCDPWFRRLFEARRAMYQQCGPELHSMFHPLWLFPADYVNAHDAEIDEERRRSVAAAPPVEVSIGRIEALLNFDRRAGLTQIKAPTLVLAAVDDYITPSYHARALADAIPRATLEIFEGGGHSIPKTRADAFNRRVIDFLTDVGGPPG